MANPGAALTATKWFGLSAAMWVQASAGNAYMFAFYSSKLKTVLHYNQLQVNNLGVAKDLGENVGLLAGFLCNKLPPWTLLSIGALTGFLGYGVTWLVVSERIQALPYWQVREDLVATHSLAVCLSVCRLLHQNVVLHSVFLLGFLIRVWWRLPGLLLELF